jgi:transcriptional regulator with XRE-family HTH domain
MVQTTNQTRPGAAEIFRERLQEVIARTGMRQAAFSRFADVDRSTLSQLLSGDSPRLPRADTLIAIASACRVSVDWLLGLSQREEIGAEIIEAMLQIEPHTRSPIDEQFVRWLREAEGFRIRTVPENLPDFLKTEDVLRFEYRASAFGSPESAVGSVGARLDIMRRPESELEISAAVQSFTTLAHGSGKWEGLPLAMRIEQLEHLKHLYVELYPSLRIYGYTLSEVYSSPFTIFGPKRVALFLGTSYLVLNAVEHVRLFGRRFDELIRLAVVQPHQIAGFLDDLLSEIR